MNIVARNLFLADLIKLISIKSFTGDEHGIKSCFELVAEIAHRFGFQTKMCAKGKVLEVYPKDLTRRIKLGIITHIDTVPFDERDWNFNPMGERSEERIYGRGTIDDKMGVLYSLYVMKELEGQIIPSWKLIIGSSEEGRWVDMEEYQREKNVIPEFLFTIDGDGIQNGCRGLLNLELEFTRKEDSEKFIQMFDTTNVTANVIPDIVYTNVDGTMRSFIGKAAHSSNPELGKNAICMAYDVYREALEEEFPGFAKLMQNYITGEEGSSIFIRKYRKEYGIYEMPGTTVAPTICRLEGDKLRLTLNVRVSPAITEKCKLYESFFKISQNYECHVKILDFIMPAFIDFENSEIKLMQNAYEKVMGRRPKPNIALGTGYNAAFENAAIFGPRFDEVDEKEEDLCHGANESRSIEDIVKFYDILIEYIKNSLSK